MKKISLSSKIYEIQHNFFENQFVSLFKQGKIDFEIDSFKETTRFDGCLFLLIRGLKVENAHALMLRIRIFPTFGIEVPRKIYFSEQIQQYNELGEIEDARICDSVIIILFKNHICY